MNYGKHVHKSISEISTFEYKSKSSSDESRAREHDLLEIIYGS